MSSCSHAHTVTHIATRQIQTRRLRKPPDTPQAHICRLQIQTRQSPSAAASPSLEMVTLLPSYMSLSIPRGPSVERTESATACGVCVIHAGEMGFKGVRGGRRIHFFGGGMGGIRPSTGLGCGSTHRSTPAHMPLVGQRRPPSPRFPGSKAGTHHAGVDVGHQLRLALARVRALLEQDDLGLHHVAHFSCALRWWGWREGKGSWDPGGERLIPSNRGFQFACSQSRPGHSPTTHARRWVRRRDVMSPQLILLPFRSAPRTDLATVVGPAPLPLLLLLLLVSTSADGRSRPPVCWWV